MLISIILICTVYLPFICELVKNERIASCSCFSKGENVEKQGRIHDIRCVPILHYAIFSDFYKSVTDGPTDRRTDTPSYRDARTHLNKAGYTNRHRHVRLGRGGNVGSKGSRRSCIHDNISFM